MCGFPEIPRASDHRHPWPRVLQQPAQQGLLPLRHRHPGGGHHPGARATDPREHRTPQEEERALYRGPQQSGQVRAMFFFFLWLFFFFEGYVFFFDGYVFFLFFLRAMFFFFEGYVFL